MAVGESVMLLLSASQQRQRLIRLIEVQADAFVLPIRWVLANKLNDAQMLDQDLNLSTVAKVSIVGIPGPRALGAPLFTYVLLLFLGWLTLSTPVLVRLRISGRTTKSLTEAKELVDQVVTQSELNPERRARLRKKMRQCQSLAELTDVVAQDRE